MAEINLQLSDLEAVLLAFDRAQSDVKQATAPVLQEMADKLRERAISSVIPHPSGLFVTGKTRRQIKPNYRAKQAGDFWWVVETPGGAPGKAEAIAEFAAQSLTPQGAAMVRALTSAYGRAGGSGGGRILYKSNDELESEFTRMLEAALEKAEAMIERKL